MDELERFQKEIEALSIAELEGKLIQEEELMRITYGYYPTARERMEALQKELYSRSPKAWRERKAK
jgi:hypothetical protein